MLYYAVFQPLYTGNPGLIWTPASSIAGLQSQNVQYANTLNLITNVEKDIKKIDADYKSIPATTTKKIETMLPDTVDPIRLRNEALAIADAAQVSISNLRVSEYTKSLPSEVGAYQVDFAVNARYPLLKKLLEGFEKNLRFYSIETIGIQRPIAKDLTAAELLLFDKESLSTTVSYKVYYLK